MEQTATREFKTITGDSIQLDVRPESSEIFGVVPGDVVRFTKSRLNGRTALVAGVADGMLWFTLDGNAYVQTTSSTCKAEYIRQYGWVTLDIEKPEV